MNKVYQVIMQDEYNNLFLCGFYKELKEAVSDINDFISVYGDYKITEEDLRVRKSTFGECFDVSLNDIFFSEEENIDYSDIAGVEIRGFILEEEHINSLMSVAGM
jgi:hypothetical protein